MSVRRTCRSAVAALTSCALVLSACAGVKERVAEHAAEAPTLAAMQAGGDLPTGTPGMRKFVVDFTVDDQDNIVLSEGGTGFLVVKSDRMEDAVKLAFRDDAQVTYRLPFDELTILAIGSSMVCEENKIVVGTSAGSDAAIGIDVVAGRSTKDGEEHLTGRLKLTIPLHEMRGPESGEVACHNIAAWEALGYDGGPQYEEIAFIAGLVAIGAVVLAVCAGTLMLACMR